MTGSQRAQYYSVVAEDALGITTNQVSYYKAVYIDGPAARSVSRLFIVYVPTPSPRQMTSSKF